MAPPLNRMVIAVASLGGLFVSLYLLAHVMGLTGPLMCGAGDCGAVQASKWAKVGWVPVAALGVGGYLSLLVVSLWGVQPQGVGSPTVPGLLLALASAALAFSAWLTYLEAYVIRAWCQWCVVSAILVILIFAAALPESRRLRSGSGKWARRNG